MSIRAAIFRALEEALIRATPEMQALPDSALLMRSLMHPQSAMEHRSNALASQLARRMSGGVVRGRSMPRSRLQTLAERTVYDNHDDMLRGLRGEDRLGLSTGGLAGLAIMGVPVANIVLNDPSVNPMLDKVQAAESQQNELDDELQNFRSGLVPYDRQRFPASPTAQRYLNALLPARRARPQP